MTNEANNQNGVPKQARRYDGGVFAVPRSIWDDPFFADNDERLAWMWLISSAAWKELKIRTPHGIIELKRGEFSFSERFLMTKWGWPKSRVHRFLNRCLRASLIKVREKRASERTSQAVYLISGYNGHSQADQRGSAPDQPRTSPRPKKKQGKQVKQVKQVIALTRVPVIDMDLKVRPRTR